MTYNQVQAIQNQVYGEYLFQCANNFIPLLNTSIHLLGTVN